MYPLWIPQFANKDLKYDMLLLREMALERHTHTHKHIQCVYQANIKWTKTKNPKQCQYKFQIKCRIKGKEQHDLKKITWIISSIYIETKIKIFNS